MVKRKQYHQTYREQLVAEILVGTSVAKPRKDDAQILAVIEEYLEREDSIGYIAMSKILKLRFGVGKKRIYRIMREHNLLCKKARKYRAKTTDSQPQRTGPARRGRGWWGLIQ